MNTVATRLVARLMLIQIAVGLAAELFVVAFAPRLLLLDRTVQLGSLTLATWVAGAMVSFGIVATFLLTRKLRAVLRALAVGSAAVTPADLLRLYALPARLTILDVVASLLFSCATMLSPLRPPTNDVYTQLALVFLTMTIVSNVR